MRENLRLHARVPELVDVIGGRGNGLVLALHGEVAGDLVAGGGVASCTTRKHVKMKQPTRIEPLGLLARGDGTVLNLADFRIPVNASFRRPQCVIAVVGSSMNAGKTTTAGGLVHGLSRAGFQVGAAKITGTGSGGDQRATDAFRLGPDDRSNGKSAGGHAVFRDLRGRRAA